MRINISRDEFLKAVEQANTTTIGADNTKSLFELEEFVLFIKGAAMLGIGKQQAPAPNDLVSIPWYKLLAMMGGIFTAGFAAGVNYQPPGDPHAKKE